MNQKEFIDNILFFLNNLKVGENVENWIYKGIAEIGYGSPGGAWDAAKYPGFQFSKNDKSYIIRPSSVSDTKAHITIEAIHLKLQLKNLNLFDTKYIEADGKIVITDNYKMTVKVPQKSDLVKKMMLENGFNNEGIICEFSSKNPDFKKIINSFFIWAIIIENVRTQFKDAIKSSASVDDGETEPDMNSKSAQRISLNQILFGPPGTGKTYNSINKALEIIGENEEKELDWKDRDKVKKQFDKRLAEGRIVFTTFHQSMSYEDFVEGIKPLKPLSDDKFIKYDVNPGIFFTICETARSNFEHAKSENKTKISFEEAFEMLKESWELNAEMKFPLKTVGKEFTILGFTSTSIQFKKASGGTGHTLSISTLRDYFYNRREVMVSGVGIYYPGIIEKLKSYQPSLTVEKEEKNFVLIIDEINRGNVSQIFGELITLIEEDKRLGKKESLEAMLPYSKEKFSVPQNLFIIGTMNTADRSVEALDTALRRRFSFEEMPPLYNLAELNYEYSGINISQLLKQINTRIEKLLDKDHQIGHSYFLIKPGENIEEKLVNSFYKNIIPLMQEYFYGDFGKIGLVLGKGFVKLKTWDKIENSFADFNTESASDFEDREVYEIIDYRNYKESYILRTKNTEKKDIEVLMDFEKAIKLLMNLLIE